MTAPAIKRNRVSSEHSKVLKRFINRVALAIWARLLPPTVSIMRVPKGQPLEFLAMSDPAILSHPAMLAPDKCLNLLVRCHDARRH